MVTRQKGVKWVKGVKYMMMDGNQAFGGEHTIEYIDIELLCCIPEICIMLLLTNITSIKKPNHILSQLKCDIFHMNQNSTVKHGKINFKKSKFKYNFLRIKMPNIKKYNILNWYRYGEVAL